ncbi:MAG: hypothetical protein C4547_02340 [Phycisphaerales bacterium]|nr:MAG: hypothetical protein C4547_02340 [Phycisphaerales bacterium]
MSVPLYLVFLISAAWPLTALILPPLRRGLRRRRGQCIACGYNLTGLASRKCPECGEAACLAE